MRTINVNMVKGHFYEFFLQENSSYKISLHENFQIYGTCTCIVYMCVLIDICIC